MPPKVIRSPVKTRSGSQSDEPEDIEITSPASMSQENFFQYIQYQQQKTEREDRIRKEDLERLDAQRLEDKQAAEQQRQDDKRQQEQDRIIQQTMHLDTLKILQSQFKQNPSNDDKVKPPTAKLPIFDIDNDSENFSLWLSRWDIHIRANNIHKIKDAEDKQNRLMLELNSGLSDSTLRWLQNRNFKSAELRDAEFLIKAIKTYIKSTSNPTVKHVEMGYIQRFENESADNLFQRINALADKCEFESIKNYKNHSCMLTLVCSVDSSLRKKMLLAKVETYEDAVAIMKAQENATKDSEQCAGPKNIASANRVSAYKNDQKQKYANANSSSHRDSQTSSRPFKCIRCHSTKHQAHNCPALLENKICNKCQTPGHLAHACLRESREQRHSFSDERSRPQPRAPFSPTTRASANTVYASYSDNSPYNSEDDTLYGRDRVWAETTLEAAIENEGGMLR